MAELVVSVLEHGGVEPLEVNGKPNLVGCMRSQRDTLVAVLGDGGLDVHHLVVEVPPGWYEVVSVGHEVREPLAIRGVFAPFGSDG